MSLRVAHVIGGLGIGGAERHLVNLLNAMSCDYRAAIFVGEKRPGPSLECDLGPLIDQHSVRIRKRNLPLGLARLANVLRRNRVNILHTHMFDASLYGALAAKMANVPVVVTSEHGENPWKNLFHRWLERRVISPLVDLRFCVSPQILALRRDVERVPAEKLQLIVNGTTLPAIRTERPGRSILTIGAVGRFITAKDYPGLLEAAAELRRRRYRFRLCIVGDGPEMGAIRNLVKKHDLEDIMELPGLVSDVEQWYEQFDLYVSSSIREGQPVAMLEAMAHGLPIVATDVGASAETVVHDEGGLIVPPGAPAALADALGRLLDDAGYRETLGRNARRRVEQNYSVQAVATYHTDTYRRLLCSAATDQ